MANRKWRTRTKGTPRQRGKKFPLKPATGTLKKNLPKVNGNKSYSNRKRKFRVKTLVKLQASNSFLFHITNRLGLEAILESGFVKPLTFSGSPDRPETHASFTSDPIELIRQGYFHGKDYVMVFNRRKLSRSGVKKVKYVTREKYDPRNLELDLVDFELEKEWRSPSTVPIRTSYVGYVDLRVPHVLKILGVRRY